MRATGRTGSTPRDRDGSPARRRGRGDGGFTLVEMMVVLLVLGVLMSVIVPTYRGARDRTQDRVAQLNLRSAFIAAKISFADVGHYGLVYKTVTSGGNTTIVNSLEHIEPTLDVEPDDDPSTGPGVVSVGGHKSPSTERTENVFRAAVLSDSDVCWFIWDDDDTGTRYGFADLYNLTGSQIESNCKADEITDSDSTGNEIDVTTSVERPICFYDDWQPIYDRPVDGDCPAEVSR